MILAKKQDGYFTVEAALVLPVVFGCILTVVYLGIYQYDRCALEQKLNLITLLSVSVSGRNHTERAALSQKYMAEPDDRFLAWKCSGAVVTVKKGKLKNEYHGTVQFPFQGLVGRKIRNIWEIDAKSEGNILNPVSFVRNYRKIVGGLSDGD